MAVRFKRTGNNSNITDHNELLNKGTRTHAEIDAYLDEIDKARGSYADLDARIGQGGGGGGVPSTGGGAGLVAVAYGESLPGTRAENATVFSVPDHDLGKSQLAVYIDGGYVAERDYIEISRTSIELSYGIPADAHVVFRVLRTQAVSSGQASYSNINASPGSPYVAELQITEAPDYKMTVPHVLHQQPNGAWRGAVAGMTFDYEYPSPSLLRVMIYQSGSYKINY
ncbi:hypothetical protein ACP26L_36305 (plasmid) [Paenibacillus sp. S-38]|uniref:hypothetical protein n=1 Tax=Paenibacillus sp. S-38 TaxID=3416710 RepID=UPI003CE8EC4B